MVIKIIHSVKTRDAKICFVKGLMISCTYKIFHRPDLLFIINEAKKRRDQVMFLTFKNKKLFKVSKQATGSQFNRGGLRAGFVRGKEAQRRLQQLPRAQVMFLA